MAACDEGSLQTPHAIADSAKLSHAILYKIDEKVYREGGKIKEWMVFHEIPGI